MIGLGDERPVDEGKNREARAKNRRVEVKVFSADQVTASLGGSANTNSANRQEGKQQKGASSSDVAEVVDRARSQLTDVLEKEVDSVSGISRRNGSWSVTVEVVEVHRVPDSTDVLSSYEVVLDDDRNLVSLERRGRYRRSQVEEER